MYVNWSSNNNKTALFNCKDEIPLFDQTIFVVKD